MCKSDEKHLEGAGGDPSNDDGVEAGDLVDGTRSIGAERQA